MIPQDYHMHTNFSCDCTAPMAAMCRAAIAKGIPEIGFTEHYDLIQGESPECRDAFRLAPWSAELARCRAEFAGQLIIRAGLELGEPHRYAAEAQALLAQYPFDYALGSLHWAGAHSVFDVDYFKNLPAAEAYRRYFVELEQMARLGGFNILSHLDVPVRTAFGVYGGYDPRDHEQYIRPVLQACIDNGLALDLNTSALRGRAKLLTPGETILRWYVAMGGERVTLGSDAHRPDQIGSHLLEAQAAARAAGLTHLTYFAQRQARLVPLPEPA